MASTLADNRAAIDSNKLARRWFSPATFGLVRAAEDAICAAATGQLLDVGCGSMPYRAAVLDTGASYTGLDIEARTNGVEFIGSATDMHLVADASFDTVLCSEVLEHVAEPRVALAEMARVLRNDGKVILTVPFLGRLHEEPYDYYRYTEHGIRALLADSGFAVESMETTGSVFSLLGHQLSSVFVVAAWRVPMLRWVALGLNGLLFVAPSRLADRLLGPIRRKLPLGYVVTARRI